MTVHRRLTTALIAVTIGMALPALAAGQGTLTCTDATDAITTGITGSGLNSAEGTATGANMTLHAEYKAGHTAIVSDLVATLAPTNTSHPLSSPGPGQQATLDVPAPDVDSIVVTFTWNQGADAALGTAACIGSDAYEVAITPSADALTKYLGRVKRAQATWLHGSTVVDAPFSRAEAARKSYGSGSIGAIFAGARAAGRAWLAGVPPLRAINRRYTRQVRATSPPRQLVEVNNRLAGSGTTRTKLFTAVGASMVATQTLGDLTRTKRLTGTIGKELAAARGAWRTAVAAACAAAGLSTPSWVRKVGK